MAERRMFAKTIIDSDAFLDMPLSTQALYFHLSMRADDDGFLNNAKKIMRTIGANQNDYDLLIAKSFIIQFDDGICVVKHWRINNYLRSDRYKPTVYAEQMKMLEVKENGRYSLKGDDGIPLGIPDGNPGKDSIGKVSINNIGRTKFTPPTLEEIEAYCKERNNKVNPKAFFDYFTTGGWKDSKGNPVKNWKQKIITWEKFETQPKPKKENSFNQMIKSNYDFDAIEKEILQ